LSKLIEVDVAVIGAGSAGLPARSEAEKRGARTLLIERGPFGTTCARVGCMPSKLLIAAADAAHGLHAASRFGVHAEGTRVDGPAVFERVRAERDRFVGFVLRGNQALPAEKKLEQQVRFVEPTLLEAADGTQVRAKAVVIATGSSPWTAPIMRHLPDTRMLHNDEVFELRELPESVAVVGAGVIGLELGQALHRLGVRVRIFGHNHKVGPITDPAVLADARAAIEAELPLSLHSRIAAMDVAKDGVHIRYFDEAGAEHTERFERVLAATGRRPNLGSLGIEPFAGELDAMGVPTAINHETAQVRDLPWFIAGDVSNHRPLLHEAADEGRIAGINAARFAAGEAPQAFQRRTPLGVVFTHPNLAIVGSSHQELLAEGAEFGTGTIDYSDQGRSRVMGVNVGRVNIYGRAGDGRLLGAEMAGPGVEHMAHLLAWSIQSELTVMDALRMPFYHPVVEEGLRTALRDLAANLDIADRSELRPR
jgi:dihydrolipoamide dehydrogenase